MLKTSSILTMAFAAALFFSACSGEPQVNSTETETTEAATGMESASMTENTAAAEPGSVDPICDMVKDETWTEFTVHEQDTVWFCSETCKQAFEGNPTKWANKAKG